jgi:hypothetical protein
MGLTDTHAEYLAYMKEWRRKNPDYMKGYMKRYRAENLERLQAEDRERGKLREPAKRRREWLKEKYGITVEQYLDMAEAQQQTCPLCERVCAKSESRESGLHVDHDHVTGKVRGLLCGRCNKLLGKLGDSLEGAERFMDRLRVYLGRV